MVRGRARQRTLILTGQYSTLAADKKRQHPVAAVSLCFSANLKWTRIFVTLFESIWCIRAPIRATKAVCNLMLTWLCLAVPTPNVSPRSIHLSCSWKLGASPKKHELANKLVTDHKFSTSWHDPQNWILYFQDGHRSDPSRNPTSQVSWFPRTKVKSRGSPYFPW